LWKMISKSTAEAVLFDVWLIVLKNKF